MKAAMEREGLDKEEGKLEDRALPTSKKVMGKDSEWTVQEKKGPLNEKVLQKILKDAQSSGNLNLSDRQIKVIPAGVFTLEETSYGEGDKWWEREPLKKLDLSHNMISEVPSDVGKLQEHLTTLLLSHNSLSQLPIEIFELNNLIKLDLSHNSLENLEDLPFDHLLNLNELLLSGNKLRGIPKRLGGCSCLEKLDLSHNSISQLPSEKILHSRVRNLQLNSNSIQVLNERFLEHLGSLQELELQDNKLKEIPTLQSLKGLQRVNLNNNQLSKMPRFGKDQQIKEVLVGFNSLVEISDEVFNLNQLAVLDVQSNQIKEVREEIAQLKKLNSLDLRNNSLTSLPPQMGFMPSLKKVLVEGNILKSYPRPEKGTKALLDFLKTRMPEDQITSEMQGYDDEKTMEQKEVQSLALQSSFSGKLVLSGRKLTSFPEVVWETQNITSLSVNQNLIAEIPSQISSLADSLSSLNVSHNKIPALPPSFEKLKGLTDLDLSNNSFAEFPIQILALSQLNTLNIRCNRLTSLPNEMFVVLKKLNTLNASYNSLKSFPNGVGDSKLVLLDLSNNKIENVLDKEILKCKSLQSLELSNNDITSIEPELGLSTHLKNLSLKGNPTKSIRLAILEKPTEQILEFLRGRIVQ
eukprot:TRINITY_DN3221_c0_g1_i1.p1 TRINITY_DN3221_c0_g1~~TRINITY_DN3221_c0_g1_i1.p1  ORF type:complete len:636 (-),score=214.16 TRINITY_DN3221_c0_g1_i1:112-2019(-)